MNRFARLAVVLPAHSSPSPSSLPLRSAVAVVSRVRAVHRIGTPPGALDAAVAAFDHPGTKAAGTQVTRGCQGGSNDRRVLALLGMAAVAGRQQEAAGGPPAARGARRPCLAGDKRG